jgi:uncharacterized protein (TIGR03905 family)
MDIFVFEPRGVCSKKMTFHIENGIILNAVIEGGCRGNTQGVTRLIEGKPVAEVIRRIKGIQCGTKGTSCPDQLACGIEQYKRQHLSTG